MPAPRAPRSLPRIALMIGALGGLATLGSAQEAQDAQEERRPRRPPRSLSQPGESIATAVAELERVAAMSTMRVNVSAVGFGISDNSAAARDLRAAAQAGGGTYVPAARAGELAGALEQALTGQAAVPQGNGPPVAVLPAGVVRGAPQNGVLLTRRLAAEFGAKGHRLLDAAAVEAKLMEMGLNPALPISLTRLTALGEALGAAFVVYPRVLGVGKPLSGRPEEMPVILTYAIVVDVKGKRLALANQVSVPFQPADEAENPVVPEAAAAMAAQLLVQRFFQAAGAPR